MPPLGAVSVLLAAALLTGCAGPIPSAIPVPTDDTGGGSATEQLALSAGPATAGSADVLGPVGWRGLNLRMSEPRAITTGMLGRRTGPATPCQQWSTKRPDTVAGVYISRRLGVAAISAAPGAAVHTPEGMTIGWTPDQVTRTYPGVSPEVPGGTPRFVPVPHNPQARYRVGFGPGGRVSGLTLELAGQDCYG
jgi:hypothetical protein